MALPYARGRHQEPIGERAIINDLVQTCRRVTTAKTVINDTGVDPNFVADQVDKDTKKARSYEVMYRSNDDPGLMRNLCRVDDCCAFGGTRLSFSTEEEPVAHWDTFHVVVAPQFTCQSHGCCAEFPADPGSLHRYVVHVHQKMAEEKGSHKPWAKSSLDALPGALSLKPNPFYKLPHQINEVPRQLA